MEAAVVAPRCVAPSDWPFNMQVCAEQQPIGGPITPFGRGLIAESRPLSFFQGSGISQPCRLLLLHSSPPPPPPPPPLAPPPIASPTCNHHHHRHRYRFRRATTLDSTSPSSVRDLPRLGLAQFDCSICLPRRHAMAEWGFWHSDRQWQIHTILHTAL